MSAATHVLLARCDWGSWRSPQEIALRLARKDRVLFVETTSARYMQIRGETGKTGFMGRLLNRELRRVHRDLAVVTAPPMLPLQFSIISRFFHDPIARGMIRLSKELLLLSIRRALKRLGWKADHVWAWYPYDVHILGRLGETTSIYRTFDEVGEWKSSQDIKGIIEELDVRMCRKADHVLCSAQSQYAKRKHLNPRTRLIPFGVNFGHFNRAPAARLGKPAARPGKPRDWPGIRGTGRTAGFAGTIDWRFDFELLEESASKLKRLDFVLVGPCRDYARPALERLLGLGNVFWLGEKPFEELPRYVAHFDVGMIPYRVGPDTNTMRVYKAFEYLAAGKQVVSTDIYEMRWLAPLVYTARDSGEFSRLILESLGSAGDAAAMERRFSAARELDWDRVCGRMLEAVRAGTGG